MFWYRRPMSCGVTGFRVMNMGEDSFGLNTNTSGQEQSVQENHAINVNIDMRNMENFNKTVLIYFFFFKNKKQLDSKKKGFKLLQKAHWCSLSPCATSLALTGCCSMSKSQGQCHCCL